MNKKTLIALGLLALFLLSSDSQWRMTAVADTDAKNRYQHEAAQKLYNDAISAYYQRNHGRSVSLFREFAKQYPRHPMADKAYLWIKFIEKNQEQSRETIDAAEILYHQAITTYYRKNYHGAIALFNEFIQKYPYHSMKDKAYNWISFIERNLDTADRDTDAAERLYNQALDSYYKQNNPSQAFSLLSSVIQQYPASRFAVNAQYWMAYLKKMNPQKMPVIVAKTPSYSSQKFEQPKSEQPRPDSKPEAGMRESDNADKLYQQGLNAYQQKKYREASSVLSMFLESYPRHPLADRVTYWIGECLYAQNNFYDAINTFKEVAIKYPASTKIADALLMIGNSYFALNDLPNARLFFERVIKNHPSTAAAETAGRKLEQFKGKEKAPSPADDKLQVYHKKNDTSALSP